MKLMTWVTGAAVVAAGAGIAKLVRKNRELLKINAELITGMLAVAETTDWS